MIRSRWALPAATVVTAASLSIMPTHGAAATRTPTVGLRQVLHHLTVTRFKGNRSLFVTPGIYAEAVGGAFEVDESRTAPGSVVLWQVRRTAKGVQRIRRIHPAGQLKWGNGLPGFFVLTVHDSTGALVSRGTQPFCAAGDFGESRTDIAGPDLPTYPFGCGDRLSRALPIGLDEGWATEISGEVPFPKAEPDGQYTLRVAIAPTYAKQLGVPADRVAKHTELTVKTGQGGGCGEICPPVPVGQPVPISAEGPHVADPGGGNNGTSGSGVPDLRALKARGLRIVHHTKSDRDYLDFAATIWNAGTGPLVVEGFRAGDKPRMTSRQFIYRNGAPARSQVVGKFEFDTRPGHHHWHMEDIAQYDLLNSSGKRVVLSEKQSFCLAPTDPVNLLRRGADWQPDTSGLWSACAGDDSIWLREVLPAGWGDTYVQTVAGQSFNITNLPNGHYFLRITADPRHRLLETDYSNNAALLPIVLSGPIGQRTLSVSS
jgi:hypothetical protein